MARFCLILIALALALTPESRAQDVEPAPEARPSPMRLAATTVDGTYMKVVYGSPHKRDRTIFGGLVPYGEVWRTGANEATEILFTDDVIFAGEPVEAGIYSMFTIPGENEWTIILNGVLGQWGAFSHEPDADILRVDVPSSTSETVYEALTMSFEDAEAGADLTIVWDETSVTVPIVPVR